MSNIALFNQITEELISALDRLDSKEQKVSIKIRGKQNDNPTTYRKEKEENELFDQALNNLELEHETINVGGNGNNNRHSKKQ